MAEGYLNRPELTRAAFVPHPWAAQDPSGSGVAYRTGDRVRRMENGELDFAGRIDSQVKVRGIRVELGEIEASLERAAAEAGARVEAVVRLAPVGGKERLIAYVRPAEEAVGPPKKDEPQQRPPTHGPAEEGSRSEGSQAPAVRCLRDELTPAVPEGPPQLLSSLLKHTTASSTQFEPSASS